VDGWYSLNILGNQDGKNLMDPNRAAGKLSNKTDILDDIMGYQVGERYGVSSHKVQIDYYPPRGDAKEAWDVIDFLGVFGLPMSMRLNLQVRDSVLAAPLVLDLARWMIVLQMAGCSGPVPGPGCRPAGVGIVVPRENHERQRAAGSGQQAAASRQPTHLVILHLSFRIYHFTLRIRIIKLFFPREK
jgi:hypothetical protein